MTTLLALIIYPVTFLFLVYAVSLLPKVLWRLRTRAKIRHRRRQLDRWAGGRGERHF